MLLVRFTIQKWHYCTNIRDSKCGGLWSEQRWTAVLSTLTTADVTVTPPSIDSYVRVSVTYDYVPLFLSIPLSATSFSIPLSVTSVMRVL